MKFTKQKNKLPRYINKLKIHGSMLFLGIGILFYVSTNIPLKERLLEDVLLKIEETLGIRLYHVRPREIPVTLISGIKEILPDGPNSHILSSDHISLDVKVKHFDKVIIDRSHAMQNGILRNPHSVPAILTYQGKKYDAKIRLKGDLADHWSNQTRWSFRVKLKKGKTIKGFNQFSISRREVRSFPYDHIFQYIGRKNGRVTPKHEFAILTVNGDYWGVMNLEEHISKQLLEKQERRDAPILKLSSELNWFYRKVNKLIDNKPVEIYSEGGIKMYNASKYSNDAHYVDLYSYAKKMVQSYNNKQALAEDIFDTESHLDALVLALIWNHTHALAQSNSRFYMNPYTLKLDVLTTDQPKIRPIEAPLLIGATPAQYLDFLSSPNSIAILRTSLNKIRETNKTIPLEINRICRLFVIDCISFDSGDLERRIDYLQENLEDKIEQYHILAKEKSDKYIFSEQESIVTSTPSGPFSPLINYPEHIYTEFYDTGKLRIYNYIPNEVTVSSLSYSCRKKKSKTCRKPNILDRELKLPPRIIGSKPNFVEITLPFKTLNGETLEIKTTSGSIERSRTIDLALTTGTINPLEVKPEALLELKKREYILITDKKITFKKGLWHIKKPITLPAGYEMHISSGTTLEFDKEAYLIVNGPIHMNGTLENKIILGPKDDAWKGIYIYNSPSTSTLSNVIIKDTDFLKTGLLHLTGGVNFYQSDILFKDVIFAGTVAEDALNIVHSNFSMDNVYFKNTRSDAFDSDFSIGSISEASFEDVGGDGLDTSGSKIHVSSARFENIKDKSVSAGEGSHLVADMISIKSSGTGVVAKDSSSLEISNLSAEKIKGFVGMTYNKKDIFEGGTLKVLHTNVGKEKFISQEQSSLLYVGTLLKNKKLDVDELYSSGSMKKQ